MIIKSSIVTAAEKRMPVEAMATDTDKHNRVMEALRQYESSRIPAPALGQALPKRAAHLAFGGARPSATEFERLIGNNDLVDEFYLQRGLIAAHPVMRIILRDDSGRELGMATGFMVSPRLLLTNWHVFPTASDTKNAIVEANYVFDIAGDPAPSYRFAVRGDLFYVSDAQLDFALAAVDQVAQDRRTALSRFGYHRLIAEPNKIGVGECITIIQHPGGARRQYSIRENQLVKILDDFLWYKSDSERGSSGAPAFNDSFQVVALHHSGAARKDPNDGQYVLLDGRKVTKLDGIDDSDVDWIANEGLRISVLCTYLSTNLDAANPFVSELVAAMRGGDVISQAIAGHSPDTLRSSQPVEVAASTLDGNDLTIPVSLRVSLVTDGVAVAASAQNNRAPVTGITSQIPAVAAEALRYPIVDRDYDSRTGYDANFLGVQAPLPLVTDTTLVATMDDGCAEIPYEHFTIVVNKQRRLPLYTAANLVYSKASHNPEPGDYTRKGLTGLGPNDQEKWLTDPRIPQQDQLPDVFYTKDGGSFDKGHVVRREDMCWGDSHEQIVRANGDTFHITNCTPQVAGFNRSANGLNNWGDLENEIQKQGATEKLSIMAGPILADNDKVFEGKDDFGPVKIQIPVRFWKLVLANKNGKLAAYAFILQQDLQNVPTEFAVPVKWTPYLVSLDYLKGQLTGFTFAREVLAADQAAQGGQEVALAAGAKIHSSASRTVADTQHVPGT